ncbi:MAG: polysaccharide biosynthesis tyrosine autokinase [Alkalinema sp. RU_4_3]|nr:polysaccharide biosynthesis tyrosine autokinase [Alkalinema sp. RU_4_3]
MNPKLANEPLLASIMQKLGTQAGKPAQPSTAITQPSPDDELVGEKTWSLARVIGMLRRKAIIIGISSLAFAGLMGLRTAKDIPEFQGSFRLLVEPVVRVAPVSDQLTDTKTPPPSDKGLDYSTQIEVLYSAKLLNPILQDIANRYPGSTYDAVVPNLKVARMGETKIIEVSYHDSNPDKALLILQKVAKSYLEYSREQQQQELRQSLNFVEDQLPKIQSRVNELNKALEDLRKKYNFVEPDKYSEDLAKQIVSLAQQRQALESDIAAMRLRVEMLRQQLGKAAALSQSAKYQAVLEKFQVLEHQIAIEAARFGPNSPNIQLLKRQQENLTPILLKESEAAVGEQLAVTESDLQILLARYGSITKSYNGLNQQYSELPNISRLFNEFKRDLEIATASLTRFLQTRDTLRTQAAKNDIPWQLLSEPKDLKLQPGGSPIKAMTSGAITGIFIGIAIAVLIEKLENTFYVVDDVKYKIRLPLIGVIPVHPDLKENVPGLHIVDLQLANKLSDRAPSSVKSAPRTLQNCIAELLSGENAILDGDAMTLAISQASAGTHATKLSLDDVLITVESHASLNGSKPEQNYWLREYDAYGFMEAFRTLGANLKRTALPKKSLVVTSALPYEGRSTVAIHLAQAIAAMGQRVLLVDAHLRKGSSQIHTLMNLPESRGLSDYLTEEASILEVIQRLSWESNLFVMPSGTSALDPTRLLASDQMIELMHQMEQSFDLIIYATPPLMGLADVKLVAAEAGAILLVTRLGRRGSADALAYTTNRLKEARLPIIGIVANGVPHYTVDLYA